MNNYLLIFLGCGAGGVSRYFVSNIVHSIFGLGFPYGTLSVNVTGSFLMGLLFILLIERLSGDASSLRALLLVGFLGGYTTFSAFSIETLNLFQQGALWRASLNIVTAPFFSIFAAWIGMILGRQL